MPYERTGYAPWSLTREAGVQSATVDGTIQVPAGASQIVGIMASVGHDSTTNGAATFALQLSGDGLSNGQETICIGSAGVVGTEVSNGMTNSTVNYDVAIPCVGSNQVSVAVAMDTDVGTLSASVTLVFA